jgi:hypothetical protein
LDIVVNGTTYQQFYGWVKEVASNPSTHGRKMATVVVDDLLGRMKSIPMISSMRTDATETSVLAMAMAGPTPAYYGSCCYGAAFYGGTGVYLGAEEGTLYGQALYGARTAIYTHDHEIQFAFDAAADSFAYVGDTWKESETSELDAIQDIMRSCLGVFYVNRRGKPIYRARTYRPLNASTSDWSGSGDTKIMKVDAVGLQDETLYNEVQLALRQRKAGTAASVLWTLRDTPTVNAYSTLTYVAGFTDPVTGSTCGCLNGVTPVLATDYTNNANLVVSVFWRAADAVVQVYNSSAGAIALTLLQLRGTPITNLDQTLFKKTGTTSPKKTRWHDAPLLSNSISASSYVNWLYSSLSLFTDKARQVTITPGSATDLEQVAQLDVNRRVTLIDGSIAFVNWVHHSIQPGSHTVTLGLSPAISSTMWILGTSQLGVDTALGV